MVILPFLCNHIHSRARRCTPTPFPVLFHAPPPNLGVNKLFFIQLHNSLCPHHKSPKPYHICKSPFNMLRHPAFLSASSPKRHHRLRTPALSSCFSLRDHHNHLGNPLFLSPGSSVSQLPYLLFLRSLPHVGRTLLQQLPEKASRVGISLEVCVSNNVLYVHTSLVLWAEDRTEGRSTLL